MRQGTGTALNIPKVIAELMEVSPGAIVSVEYDLETEELTVKKVKKPNANPSR